jgi:hypothetical protein
MARPCPFISVADNAIVQRIPQRLNRHSREVSTLKCSSPPFSPTIVIAPHNLTFQNLNGQLVLHHALDRSLYSFGNDSISFDKTLFSSSKVTALGGGKTHPEGYDGLPAASLLEALSDAMDKLRHNPPCCSIHKHILHKEMETRWTSLNEYGQR